MRRLLIWTLLPPMMALAAGCSAPSISTSIDYEAQRLARQAEQKAKDAVWHVECTDDHHGTAERRCSAKNGNFLYVTFVDGRGPYVSAGPHWSIDKPNVIRIDNGPVRAVSKSKSMLPADTLVKEMLRGQIAYATCFDWPYDTPVHSENSLVGFKEAYVKLLELKAARPPRPAVVDAG